MLENGRLQTEAAPARSMEHFTKLAHGGLLVFNGHALMEARLTGALTHSPQPS